MRRTRSRVRRCAFEALEDRCLLTAVPFGAESQDTGEFFLGDVYVTVVGFESNGTRDPDTEDWNDAYRNGVKTRISEGLNWWKNTLAGITSKHELNFQIDFTHLDNPVPTGYEPIDRPSFDFSFWVYDFLDQVGFNSTRDHTIDTREFNHAQRAANNANWAFTIFVVNDENDLTETEHPGRFAPGGFDRAFAFPGGLHFIMPAHRPASTTSHETGHMFWGRDEYRGAGNYTDMRGYYNAQNSNAWDNPLFTSGQQQREPSIMDRGACDEGGGLLCDAYQANTSATSSLEMIGWRDSDSDGVFDVLDVSHTLGGSGFYDASSGNYRFSGTSAVQTTPNLNSSGQQNDVTIARISRAQFRIDGGAWQTAASYDSYIADLDLTIPMPAGSQVQIRTIDDVTGITSPVFTAGTDRPAATLHPGINGAVWNDSDGDGQRGPAETGLSGIVVQLVDGNGDPLQLTKGVEPDDTTNAATKLNNAIPEVTLSGVGSAAIDDSVFSLSDNRASTGSRVFANFRSGCGVCSEWSSATLQLRMDFAAPVTTVSLDGIARNNGDRARLEIYDANDNLLARYTTQELTAGQAETMTLSRPTAEIAYALAGGHPNSTVLLDNLRFGPQAVTTTDAQGFYALAYLAAGDYTVQVVAAAGSAPTNPASGSQAVSVAAGQSLDEVDFGLSTTASRWQNPGNRFDVNNDGVVSPIDALLIINDINANGARQLTTEAAPPYRDVNGDRAVAPIDVLQVINEINSQAGREGEAPGAAALAGGSTVTSSSPAAAAAESEAPTAAAAPTPALAARHAALAQLYPAARGRIARPDAPRETESAQLEPVDFAMAAVHPPRGSQTSQLPELPRPRRAMASPAPDLFDFLLDDPLVDQVAEGIHGV